MSRIHGSIVVETTDPDADWMVLVHGVSQDHRVFDAQVQCFANTYRIVQIDLPGHGISTDIPAPYGLVEFADHIQDCISAIGAMDAIFWGTHLGASAGLIAACENPKLFSALVLESPVFPGRPTPSVSSLLSEVAAAARRDGIREARELWWTKGPWFDLMRSDPEKYRAKEHRRIIADFEGGPWLETELASKPLESIESKLQYLCVPTILLNGEHDVEDFLLAADALQELIPNSSRVSVPGGGGFPLWEVPEVVNELVSRALSDTFEAR